MPRVCKAGLIASGQRLGNACLQMAKHATLPAANRSVTLFRAVVRKKPRPWWDFFVCDHQVQCDSNCSPFVQRPDVPTSHPHCWSMDKKDTHQGRSRTNQEQICIRFQAHLKPLFQFGQKIFKLMQCRRSQQIDSVPNTQGNVQQHDIVVCQHRMTMPEFWTGNKSSKLDTCVADPFWWNHAQLKPRVTQNFSLILRKRQNCVVLVEEVVVIIEFQTKLPESNEERQSKRWQELSKCAIDSTLRCDIHTVLF